ncbi:hypothetical protein B0H14DRAFT_2567373 [Mycena olivaceomarginata]|nr:hypothetical protein B0H14DRAFT_2567373 [Mycena olivaceomarginata]
MSPVRAKKMLQKCAYAMLSQQELSSQQVVSYLLDFEDHFTNHSYRNFYWTSFGNFINKEDPSPECYITKSEVTNGPEEKEGELDVESDSESDPDDEPVMSNLLNDFLDPQEAEDVPDTTTINEEIRVFVDGSGNLIPMGNQLADYAMRGHPLDGVCVWDFISQIDRVRKTSDNSQVVFKRVEIP